MSDPHGKVESNILTGSLDWSKTVLNSIESSSKTTRGDTMARRQQRGWLKKENRIQGETWVLYFRTTRNSGGKRVENKIPIGLVLDFPDRTRARAEVERLHLPINPVDSRRGGTFGDLALHYAEHELIERSESIHPKAHATIKGYERVLRNRLLPKWGNRVALGIEPLEVEEWLTALKKEETLQIQRSIECDASCRWSIAMANDMV